MEVWTIKAYHWNNGERTLAAWADGLNARLERIMWNDFVKAGYSEIVSTKKEV